MRVAQKNKLSRNSENQWGRRALLFFAHAEFSFDLYGTFSPRSSSSSGGGVTFFVLLKRVDLPLQMTAECFVVRCVASRARSLAGARAAAGKKKSEREKEVIFPHTLWCAVRCYGAKGIRAGRQAGGEQRAQDDGRGVGSRVFPWQ
jgi:hypothetical protein